MGSDDRVRDGLVHEPVKLMVGFYFRQHGFLRWGITPCETMVYQDTYFLDRNESDAVVLAFGRPSPYFLD